MKLPFSFNIKLVFRILLPGFVVALSLLPAFFIVRDCCGLELPLEYFLILASMFIGWLINIFDSQIYMLYEGRRYWPAWIWSLFYKFEQKRLDRLLSDYEKSKNSDHRKYIETSVELRRFPINDEGGFMVIHPTRLGNILYAYEQYPLRAYGMDSIFYWYRIWLVIDDDLREHIDNQQAVVDSSLYTSFALIMSFIFSCIYASVSMFEWSGILTSSDTGLYGVFAAGSLLGSYILYRGSLHAQAQFGEFFKSLFDMYKDKVSFDDVIDEVARLTNDTSIVNMASREKYKIAWRYLHNNRVKVAGEIYTVPEARKKYSKPGQT